MSKRAQFDKVFNSIMNGQSVQAFEQMQEIGDMDSLLDYFNIGLDRPDLAIRAAKIYISNMGE